MKALLTFKSLERQKRIELIAIAAILLLAFTLRLIHLDSMEFGKDAAFNLMKARELAQLERFPLTSASSSTDIPEPPIFMYLLALPVSISDDAVFVTGSIAALNALAVLPLYLLARRHVALGAAMLSAALYAVNPWQLLYSRKIWTQDVLPFFALLFLLTLFEAVFHERPKLLVASLALLALTVQLHLSAWFMIPFTVAFLVWQRRNVRWREIGMGTGLAVLLFIPYSVYLAMNVTEVLGVLRELGGGRFIPRATGILYPLQLVTTDGVDHVTLLFSSYEKFSRNLIDPPIIDNIARALLILGGAYSLLHPSRSTRALGGYAAFSAGFIILSNVQIFPHYYNAALPVLIVLASLPITLPIVKRKRWLAAVSWAVYASIFVTQLYFSLALLKFIASEDCIWGEYGPPYRVQVERVSNAMEAMRQEGTPIELEALHQRASSCVDWDIQSTRYIYGQLQDDLDPVPGSPE